MLIYRCTNTLKVVGFSDSDYAGCVDDKNFTSDYIFIMDEEAISWKSVKKTHDFFYYGGRVCGML